MLQLDVSLRNAEANLNRALRDFELPGGKLPIEFRDLKLQFCIFQYDICSEMLGIARNQPRGFAAAVALKGIVHRLYEYESTMRSSLIPRFVKLAQTRGVQITDEQANDLSRRWKVELKKIRNWTKLRNHAAGHYDHDLTLQVKHLKSLEICEVMDVAAGFLSFNIEWGKILRDIGRGGESTGTHQ